MNEFTITPNPTGPTFAIDIDKELCIACNSCANICRIQTILPNAIKGKPPVVAYPDECWYCGCCVEACPTGALEMRLPLNQRILFKDKESGSVFRLGTKDAPAKTFFKAPYGWIDHPEFGAVMQKLERKDTDVYAVVSESAGRNIGRFFGEKTARDNSGKFEKLMKLVGFKEIVHNIGDLPESDGERLKYTVAVDIETDDADINLDLKELSVLLHRLCGSNNTAVQVFRSL